MLAANDACPLPDIFNFLSGFPFFCQKSLQPGRLLDALLFAFLNQDSKGIAIDRAADLIVLCLCGIGGIVHTQAAVDADLILLLQVAASFLPVPVPRPHCPHSGSKHGGHKSAVRPLFLFLQPQCGLPVQREWIHPAR